MDALVQFVEKQLVPALLTFISFSDLDSRIDVSCM